MSAGSEESGGSSSVERYTRKYRDKTKKLVWLQIQQRETEKTEN